MTIMTLHPDFVSLAVNNLPDEIRGVLMKLGPGLCVAGGFVRDTLLGEEPKDIDLFGTGVKVVADAITVLEKLGYKRVSDTRNAVTFLSPEGPKVQVIRRVYYPTHEALVDSFDFSICQTAVWWAGDRFVGYCTEAFSEDIVNGKARYTAPERDEDPGASVLRMVRFAGRGFEVPQEDIENCLARFYAKLAEEPEPVAREKIKTAFVKVRRGGGY